jgi:hypothetical protein
MRRPSAPRYEHRQGGGFTRLSFLLGLALLPALYALDPRLGPALAIATPLLLLMFAAFDGLTIRVNADEITWHFGHFGWPRGRARLSDIDVASITRTTFWEGWVIRLTRRGWLYNVSGYDAVLIRRHNGKSFLLGTDEPRRLKAAIDAGLQRVSPHL